MVPTERIQSNIVHLRTAATLHLWRNCLRSYRGSWDMQSTIKIHIYCYNQPIVLFIVTTDLWFYLLLQPTYGFASFLTQFLFMTYLLC